jgi:cytochrome P450
MPAFAFRHIKDLYPSFWKKGVQMIDGMTLEMSTKSGQPNGHTQDGQTEIEISGWASRATLDIISQAGIGYDFGALKDPNTHLIRTYRQVFEPSRAARLLGLLFLFLPGFLVQRLPVKRNSQVVAAAKVIRSTCMDAIKRKRALSSEERKAQGIDILSIAMDSGGFSDENLVDQMMTFLAAGHETTATSLTWAAYRLCKSPDVQGRLREEIRAHLPSPNDHDAVINDKDIDSLPYLNAVTQEVLRFHPPIGLTPRTTARDTTIAGHYVPKGTRVMIAMLAVNQSKELWGEDATEFKPERWLGGKRAGNGGADSNYAMMTFLHGPRSCIGQAFARGEFKCLLALLVGRLEMILEDPDYVPEIKEAVTSKPAGGLKVLAKVLDGW